MKTSVSNSSMRALQSSGLALINPLFIESFTLQYLFYSRNSEIDRIISYLKSKLINLHYEKT